MTSSLLVLLGGVIVFVYVVLRYVSTRPQLPPDTISLPGPLGLPLVGAVPFLPSGHIWLKLTQWANKYGPIYQVKLGAYNYIWITSPEIAEDLLNKRQAIYSSRKFLPSIQDDNRKSMHYLALMANGPDHKRGRRFLTSLLSSTPRPRISAASLAQTKALILSLTTPSDPAAPELSFQRKVELAIATVTTSLAWSDEDPATAQESINRSNAMILKISPDGDIVNKLPFLRNLPAWVPLSWQPWKTAEAKRTEVERNFWLGKQARIRESMEKRPVEGASMYEAKNWVEKFYTMPTGTAGVSEEEAGYGAGFLALVGSVLLSVPVQTFFVAMSEHPEWMRKGQEEVDAVCGRRMPVAEDIKELPTVRAIIRECFRWRTPVPVGVPHVVEEDDVYGNYFIPKGSVCCVLDWALTHDAELYPEPEKFNPSRWLLPTYPTYKEPLSIYPQVKAHPGFGWGRRTCIGQDYAEMVFITMCAGLLWACDIRYKEGRVVGKMGAHSVIVRPDTGDVLCDMRDSWREDVVNGVKLDGKVEAENERA